MTADAAQAVADRANDMELKTNYSQIKTAGGLSSQIHIRVAYLGPREQYRCRHIAINAINQGEDLMIRLHQLVENESGRFSRFVAICKDAFLMRQDSVWIVSVSPLSSDAVVDLEEQAVDSRVYIRHSEYSQSLTHAFHYPAQLQSASNFVLDHLKGIVGDNRPAWTVPRHALCLRKALSRKTAFVWFCVALALSIGIGIAAGLAEHDLDLGFSVGTGVLAVLAAVQCVLIWQISATGV